MKTAKRQVSLAACGLSLVLVGCSWMIDERGLAGALAVQLEPIAAMVAATAEYQERQGHWPDNPSALAVFADERDLAFDPADFEWIAFNPKSDGSVQIDSQLDRERFERHSPNRGSVTLSR